MKKIYLIFLLSVLYGSATAQWEKRIGVNLLPLTVRSLEITSEFSPKSCFAFTVNAGYVNNTAYEGLSGSKVGDGVTERKTSGTFYKIGARYYFRRYADIPPKVNIFAGALLIGSHYAKTAYRDDFIKQTGPQKVSKSGFSWGPALTAGLTFRISRSIQLDTGIQYGFLSKADRNIGRGDFNYEPGFGASKTPLLIPFIPPLALLATNSQAILALKYQF
jgi:outer membrane protein W